MHKLLFLIFLPLPAAAQLHLAVTQLPASTPPGDSIYVVGSFNGWNPGDPAFKLVADTAGYLRTTLPPGSGTVEFKFTRGSWATVEGTASGSYIPNRTYTYGNGDTVFLQINGWESPGGGSTAAANVSTLLNFSMPQLGRNRRIWIYLPPDYDSSATHYRVLYMHDGQNVFDASTSFSGEWEVDETLNTLFASGDAGCIVVAVDNGGVHRLDEYNPWVHPVYGGGEGDEYVDFLIYTLKPYVDQNYRTLPGREFTAILGSSMGGLISFYAALRNPEVFGRAGIFSPAYWVAPASFSYPDLAGHPDPQRFFQLAGALEGNGSVAADAQTMHQELTNAGFGAAEIQTEVVSDGEHSEWFWAREFEDAYLWLWAQPLHAGVPRPSLPPQPYPNPGGDWLHIKHLRPGDRLSVTDLYGREMLAHLVAEPELRGSTLGLPVHHLRPGCYYLRIEQSNATFTLSWMKSL